MVTEKFLLSNAYIGGKRLELSTFPLWNIKKLKRKLNPNYVEGNNIGKTPDQ